MQPGGGRGAAARRPRPSLCGRGPMIIILPSLVAMMVSLGLRTAASQGPREPRRAVTDDLPSAAAAAFAQGRLPLHAGVVLPYPPALKSTRPLRYRTQGVDTNRTLRESAAGIIFVGAAIGAGYITAAVPSSSPQPLCQSPCARGPVGCGGLPAAPTTRCGCAADGSQLVLACQAGSITAVTFAAVGTPTGMASCANFTRGRCDGDPATARAYVRKLCVGKKNCTLVADIGTFNGGRDPCVGTLKHAMVAVVCSDAQQPPPPPEQHPSGMDPYPGNAIPHWQTGVHTAARYRALAKQEYDQASPENACKFDATETTEGKFSFQGCDLLANFSRSSATMNGSYFGTAVVWGIALPGWIQHTHWNETGLSAAMQEHIEGVMARYAQGPLAMESVVLVNEAASNMLQPGTPQDGMFKHTVYYPTVPDYVALAFTAAQKAAPAVKLFYNDYGWAVGDRFDVVFSIMKNLTQRQPRVPVSGVGLQMHCDVGSFGSEPTEFAQQLSRNIANITSSFDLDFRITVRCQHCVLGMDWFYHCDTDFRHRRWT